MEALDRAQGLLLGQLAGDSLGGLVEFESEFSIRTAYPGGVRQLADGGRWETLAGQPTDDSEMALMLARTLVREGNFNPQSVKQAYLFWFHSDPFDLGGTIAAGLSGSPNFASQSNGALMRISPLGIFGAGRARESVAAWAEADACLTHPHPVCRQANILFTLALAEAVETGASPETIYGSICREARDRKVDPTLLEAVLDARDRRPRDFVTQQGYVLIAFQNALWQLLHADNLEEGVVDTIMHGGDTDTNAAICGALLGAVYGRGALPRQWVDSLLRCRPERGRAGVLHPRPACFWPNDALELAARLLER